MVKYNVIYYCIGFVVRSDFIVYVIPIIYGKKYTVQDIELV